MRLLAILFGFPLLVQCQNLLPKSRIIWDNSPDLDEYALEALQGGMKAEDILLALQSSGSQWANQACVEDVDDIAGALKNFAEHLLVNHTLTLTEFDAEVTLKVIDSNGGFNGGFLKGRKIFQGRFSECRGISYKREARSHTWKGDMFRLFFGGRNGSTCTGQGTIFAIDLCLPRSCSAEEIKGALWEKLDQLCLIGTNDANRVNKTNATTYVVIILMSIIVGISIAAGLVDFYLMDYLKESSMVHALWFKIFLAFSLSKNMKEVLNTDNVNKPGQIGPLNCMRFLSMCWIILNHCNLEILSFLSNLLDVLVDADKPAFYFLSNSFFSVDTFFFIGGVLLAFLWFKELKKNRRATLSGKGWLMFYVHRIIRLSPIYYLAVFFWFAVLLPSLPDSSNRLSEVNPEKDACYDHWWINIIYLQNIVDSNEQCYGVTWYLATDMQMYLFTPLLLIPLAYNMVLGLVVAGSILLLSTAANVFTIYHFRYPAMPPVIGKMDPKIKNPEHYVQLMYYAAWIRCQVYIIGILVGYLLQMKKTMKINKLLNLVLWGLCFAGMLFVVPVPSATHIQDLMPLFWRAAYSSLSKPLWGICLSWIVISCYYGYGGVVNSFMSWAGWAPLGRLTYTAYLIHYFFIYYLRDVHDAEIIWGNYLTIFSSFAFPAIILTYCTALFASCFFEISVGRVEALLLNGHRRPAANKKNGTQWANQACKEDIEDLADSVLTFGKNLVINHTFVVTKFDEEVTMKDIWFKRFMAFSLSKNMKDGLNTDKVNKPGQIGPLNCMRFLSMCWIIMGHANSFMLGYLSNIREIVRDADKPLFYIISNSYFSVDTDVPEDPCRQYWWVNFLYLQNIVHAKEECYGITWYLATDMQMYIFTPLLLIPFAYNMVLGLAMASSVLLLSTAANIYTVYHFRFPGFPPALNAQDPKVKHADDYSMLMYEAPWIRCQVYIIGILVGYLLHNKKTIRINKTLNLPLFLLSFAVMLFVVMIPSANPHQHLMPLFWRAAYSALSKPLWGLCLSWIVISCYYGYGGLVNSFMSWPGWAPLGRLTYTAYLIHFLIIYYFIDIHEPEIFWGNFLDLFANFTAPAILITYVLSLFWSCLFEVSIGKVEALLLGTHRRRGGEKLEQEKPIIENGVAGQDRQNEVNLFRFYFGLVMRAFGLLLVLPLFARCQEWIPRSSMRWEEEPDFQYIADLLKSGLKLEEFIQGLQKPGTQWANQGCMEDIEDLATSLADFGKNLLINHTVALTEFDQEVTLKALWFKLFMAFSLSKNMIDVLSTANVNKPGQIGPLNCMRFLSMCWIIMGHSNSDMLAFISNVRKMVMDADKPPFYLLSNAFFSVDTFFFTGGVLLSFIWFKELKRNRRATLYGKAWLMFYVHRIIRKPTEDSCRRYWWADFLYVQNLVHPHQQCYGVTWYLATDMQMYVFTPLLLIPLAYNVVS
ncbi:unnamed protein product, partial [Mesorhabditis spiculigera]